MCDYPTKSLSGVGIVYKFCSYIDSLLGKNYADDYLDLVSLGLIADVMDTRDFETQYFIQEGLKNVRNPLMKELMGRDAMHFKDGETPLMNSVAWYVAPLINSITRVGSTEDKYIVFEGMLDFKAYTLIPSTKRGCKGQEEPLVTQACRVAANNKNH
jgi:single-stranded-DNA-specific exonuclease